jgi:hypothetical protein
MRKMKTIYLDADFRCHVANDGTMSAIETEVFDGKCDEYIEGYRFVPAGYTWVREDGTVFEGEMISPWQDWAELDAAQREYERKQLADMQEAIAETEAAEAAYNEGVQEA